VKAFLLIVLKKLGYLLAVCVILAAMLVSVSQLLTPLLNSHRTDFANWASTLLGMPVDIDSVRASWYRYQPEIRLNRVTVFDKEAKNPILQVTKVRIFFSILQSVWARQPIPSGIMVAGTSINLHQSASGQILVQGFPSIGGFSEQPYTSEAKFLGMLTWLSQQPHLVLRDIDVVYRGWNGQKRFVTLQHLSFENSKEKHTVLGDAILHQNIPVRGTVAIDWDGDLADINKVHAKGYLYLSGVSLAQWLKGSVWQGWQIKDGLASAKIWATWQRGSWQRVQSTLRFYGVKLYSTVDKSVHTINRLSGNIGWKREGEKQIIAGDDILIDLPIHLWPITSFYIAFTPEANGYVIPQTVRVGYLDLHDIQGFLLASPSILSASIRDALNKLRLHGQLQNVAMTFPTPWQDWVPLSFMTDFRQLTFASWKKLPAASHLSGQLKWDGIQGDLLLQSKQALLQYDSMFTRPMHFEQLSGALQLQKKADNAWMIDIHSLHALNHDMTFNMKGALSIPAQGSLLVDMAANFTLKKAQLIPHYLPLRLLEPDLARWLQQAFLSGNIQGGEVILRGKLSNFPFDKEASDKSRDVFLISSTLNDLTFRFDSDWPVLQHVNGKLIFAGREMIADISRAEILGVPITNIKGTIPSIGTTASSILTVSTGDIHTDFAKGLSLIHASPLEKTLGKAMASMQVQGPMILKLGLTVPLTHPDRASVQGNITFQNAQLDLVPWHLLLVDLHGLLHFTEKTIRADDIQGKLFNKPVVLQLDTIQSSQRSSSLQVKLKHYLAIKDLQDWLKLPISDFVQGSTNVNVEIDAALASPIKARIRSDLVGLTINLPDQYAKAASVLRRSQADITIQQQQPLRLRLAYGNLLGAALILENKQNKFSLVSGHVNLGGSTTSWPDVPGLRITGDLEQLDWDRIKEYMNQSGNSRVSAMLHSIDIRANVFNILGQRLTQARLQVVPAQNNWYIDVTSQQIAGKVQVPVMLSQQPITATFQHFALFSPANQKRMAQQIEVKQLPAISFAANRVSYNDIPLGEISFKTSPIANGLTIQSLKVTSQQMSLLASGSWTQTNRDYLTELQGRVTSTYVSHLLESLELDVHNFIAHDGQLNFNLYWRDAPYAPTLTSLSGKASLNIGRGQILEVSQASGAKIGIGRMLSIFSLQTIPRRLSLDFSDIFQKGYSFDSIRGDFNLQNGSVYTKNSRIDGPIARVDISGRIGLVEKDYDLALSVTPYVTSSLPVAATLLTGPVVGVATWAVTKVINSQVSKMITYHYVVQGPWKNPSWQSVTTKAKKSG
jgi:uncharacterized protein (TIGR02099 family)